tara:strand:+ start:1903 stop:2529 length:627 start_codon:yes stop_codon:yes gene_type:complete
MYSFTAYAGVNVGISGQMGLFTATGTESHADAKESTAAGSYKSSDTEIGAAGYASVFLEGVLQDRILVGIDYVPAALETDTVETRRSDKTTGTTAANVEQKVQLDFEDLTTFYLGMMVTENLYVKGGMVTVDVITNENLGTGGTYGNTNLDGTMVGVGYHKSNDSGMFMRVEGSYMEFDSQSLTSGDMTVKLNSLDGVTGKISIGKSF